MVSTAAGFDTFLADIAPFFYRRALTYVDVGAYEGEMLGKLLASPLKVREAHLVEPNPASLATARRKLAGTFKGQSLNFHAMALGEAPGRVRLARARSMTKVLADGAIDGGDPSVFEAECSTLDALASRFTDGRVSLLKIDVEGYEDRVLAGAQQLLAAQKVDLVYIEAGIDPQGTQQVHYRRIEDQLAAHGYRLFRIYEQQHEWLADSPLLRRVNLAFMSTSFAERNPYRLTLELNAVQDALAQAQAEAADAQAALQAAADRLAAVEADAAQQSASLVALQATLDARQAEAAQALADARRALADAEAARGETLALLAETERRLDDAQRGHAADVAKLNDSLAALQDRAARELAATEARHAEQLAAQQSAAALERDTAESRQRQAEQARAALAQAHDAVLAELAASRREQQRQRTHIDALTRRVGLHEAAHRDAADALHDVFDCVGGLQRSTLALQSQAAQAMVDATRLRQSRSYRMARLIGQRLRTAGGWLGLPAALWREYHAERPPRPTAAAQRDQLARDEAPRLNAANPLLSLALAMKPQFVVLPASNAAIEIWLQTIASDAAQPVLLELKLHAGAASPVLPIEVLAGAGPARALEAGAALTTTLQPGPATRWLSVPARQGALLLELRRVRGDLPVIKLERRPERRPLPADAGPPALPKAVTAAAPPAPTAAVELPATGTALIDSAALELKLWGGYAPYALAALEERKHSRAVPGKEREDAAWYLTRWYLVEGDLQRALENVAHARSVVKKPHRRWVLAEVACLLALGRHAEADDRLAEALVKYPEKRRDHELMRSTVVRRLALERGLPADEVEALQLQAINALYHPMGLAPLEKKDPSRPLALDNIVALADPPPGEQQRKVSVIVPAYNAEASIDAVLDSLLRQTWRNLEVIVVDDLSTDGTCERVERFAAADARVRLVRKAVNEGAYPTRNAGARLASGHFITVHDSDDWSHPQKLEIQIATLDAQPGAVAVTSHWVRVGEHLEIVGPWVTRGSLYDVNFSSLLFERRLLDQMGLWDAVKVSGDAEFVYRLRAVHGENCVAKVHSSYLLSLSMVREDSLTRAKATHLRSLFYGLRWNYRDAYLWWCGRLVAGQDSRPADPATGRRRYPVPLGMRPGRAAVHAVDLVVVADFAELGAALDTALARLAQAATAGQRVAAFHWRRYERPARVPLLPAFYQACMDHDIAIASPGDSLRTTGLVVVEAALLMHRIEPAPTIEAGRIEVLADADVAGFDRQLAAENLAATFSGPQHWLPADPETRTSNDRTRSLVHDH